MTGVLEVEVDWRYMGGQVVYLLDPVEADDMVQCIGRVQTGAPYRFWAAVGPEIARAVQKTWELREAHRRFNARPGPRSTPTAFDRR
jgi:hypothetical protein